MAEKKQENERTVRVTVRISVPDVAIADMVLLESLVAGLVQDLDGATYDLSISSPRPER